MKSNVYLILLVSMLFMSCTDRTKIALLELKVEELSTENRIYKDSIEHLNDQIKKYQLTPEKIIATAKELIKQENIDALIYLKDEVKKYLPESPTIPKLDRMISDYEKAIELKKIAEEKKRLGAVNKLRKKYDDVSGITWYYNPYYTHYSNTNLFSVYLGKKDNDVWMRLEMSYKGSNWIFFEKAYLSYEGNTKEIIFDKYRQKETENEGGSVWEWIDVNVDRELYLYLKQLSQSKTAKMRLSGKYTKTRNLSSSEIKGLQDVILAYEVLLDGK